MAPGAYDALTARLVEHAGFPAVYLTGAGISYSTLGQPDLGLVSFAEMVERAARVVEAVRIPVIAPKRCGHEAPETAQELATHMLSFSELNRLLGLDDLLDLADRFSPKDAH